MPHKRQSCLILRKHARTRFISIISEKLKNIPHLRLFSLRFYFRFTGYNEIPNKNLRYEVVSLSIIGIKSLAMSHFVSSRPLAVFLVYK